MPRTYDEREQPITDKLTIKDVEYLMGRAPDDVYLENKRVVCVFAQPVGAITRFHLKV